MKFKYAVVIILLLAGNYGQAQLMKSISKLKNNIESGILGDDSSGGSAGQQETNCACAGAETIFTFNGNLNLNYLETSVCIADDGSILLRSEDYNGSNFYISDKGKITGPFSEDDPKLRKFDCLGYNGPENYPEYIKKRDGRYVIVFNGKEYGPFAEIRNFYLTRSKRKFAAITVKDGYTAGFDMEEIEKKMENASEQEKVAMALELSTKMQEQIQAQLEDSGELDLMPKLTTNIQGAEWDPMSGLEVNAVIKFDDICLVSYDKISDMNGKVILSPGDKFSVYGDNVWINRNNSRYAWFDYGTLYFSDGKKCNNVFSPSIFVEGGTEFIRYMFYSPADDAIKMCKTPF